MKKTVLASFALLALLAGANSCSMEEPQAGSDSRIEFVIPEFEDDYVDTKVTTVVSGSSISSTWDAGDRIGVFPDMGGDQVSFTVSSGAGTGTCSFNGHGWALVSAAKYSAYYPFSKENYGDANAYKNVKLSYLGQSQTSKGTFSVGDFDFLACTKAEPSFDDPTAPGGKCTFNFKHLGGLVILDVTFPQAAFVSTLELECEEPLFPQAGFVDLSQDDPAFTATAMGNSLSLDLGGMSVSAGETIRFYMMSAPANLLSASSNPTVKATTSTGYEMAKQLSGKKNLKAGKSWSISTTLVASSTPVATLKATPAAFYPDFSANDITFRVKATEQYTITPGVDWLTFVSSTSIDANTTEYTYRTTINNTSTSRVGNISIDGATKHANVRVEQDGLILSVPMTGEGHTIYTTTGNYKYRYGPSIIMNDDGTIDAWFSSPGDLTNVPNRGMADVFTWRRTSNGGQTWTAEQIVLTGSAKPAADWWSVCDPGAAHFDGYYYMAYTSTTNTSSDGGLQGLENDCFIARGTSPSGPWEKWNGTGWGSNPQPIIEYTGPSGKWGIGEPSIVVKDNTIYLYYTYNDGDTPLTKVATADRTNPNWPGSLTFHGTAVDKHWLAATHDGLDSTQGLYTMYDSCDVKYVEDYDLFFAFHSSWRITSSSRLSVWTSVDGLTFEYLGSIQNKSLAQIPWGYDVDDPNLIPYIHNVGVSGDGLGHVNLSKTQYLSFGYSPIDATDRAHGQWSTYWCVLNYE
ncbi:MAG: hypothetical protein J5801_01500 [Bacteroidales bacterium]|nr:hypothetical protein [Bacteroidales bacterium]